MSIFRKMPALLLCTLMAGCMFIKDSYLPQGNSPDSFGSPSPTTSEPKVSYAPCLYSSAKYPQSTNEWLRINTRQIEVNSWINDLSDLKFLETVLGNVNIVGLGEATHGTHEFFTIKNRIIQYLILEMDFTLLAFEAPQITAEKIDDYIQGGTGDPMQLLNELGYWPWITQEVFDLITWLKSYNQSVLPDKRVHFTGFDILQTGMDDNVKTVVDYFKLFNEDTAARYQDTFSCITKYSNDPRSYASLPKEMQVICQNNLKRVKDEMEQNRETYISGSSKREFDRIFSRVKSIQQFESISSINPQYAEPLRDELMADNIHDLRTQHGANTKLILWGHNVHIGVNHYKYLDKSTAGEILRTWYEDQYYVIGFTFFTGSFNAIPFDKNHSVSPPPQDSYEAFLHQAGLPSFYLGLREIDPNSEIGSWLSGLHCERSIGAVYDDSKPEFYWDAGHLLNEMDAIIYLEDTSPSILLLNQ